MTQVLSLMAEKQTTEWFLRIAGDDSISPLPDENGETVLNPVENQEVEFDAKILRSSLHKGELAFDYSIVDSSMLPTTQQETYNKIGMLLQWQVVSPDDVLRYNLVDIPHADRILAGRERAQAEAEAFAPEQAAQNVPQPGAGAVPSMPQSPVPQPTSLPPEMEQNLAPPTMDPEQMMAAAQQLADEMGVPIEEALAALAGG
jgi:hypothetical protein